MILRYYTSYGVPYANAGAGGCMTTKEVCRFDGRISNRVSEWQFLESKGKGELVYVRFEGYYEEKGGRWQSPVINLATVGGDNS